MRLSKLFMSCLMPAFATVFCAGVADASISVSFDSADSDVAIGIYAFQLAGAGNTAFGKGSTDAYATFMLSHFVSSNYDPKTPQGDNPLGDLGSPSGYSSFYVVTGDANHYNAIVWYNNVPSVDANGIFSVRATPDLNGTLYWQFGTPDRGGFFGTVSTDTNGA